MTPVKLFVNTLLLMGAGVLGLSWDTRGAYSDATPWWAARPQPWENCSCEFDDCLNSDMSACGWNYIHLYCSGCSVETKLVGVYDVCLQDGKKPGIFGCKCKTWCTRDECWRVFYSGSGMFMTCCDTNWCLP